uniref:Cadherin domain-containing protein n=1 Tax=Macrostomum lignano TaxID=282301 RepID=A0A1I8GRY1_9PLAT
YELQPSSTVFELKEIRTERSLEPIPVLKQLAALDRETVSRYEFILYAMDRGSPSQTGSATIVINIADVNDNYPKFNRTAYSANVSESAALGQTVLCVLATDPDEGVHGLVRYGIKNVPGGKSTREFVISTASGCISVARPLDYETQKQFVFTVIATDGGSSKNSAEAEVVINVLDVNDFQPEVSISAVKQGVLEGNRTGDVAVAMVTVIDKDTGPGGEVTCEVEPTDKFRLEKSTENLYKLLLTAILDRETTSTQWSKVCCRDHGTPSLSSCKDHSFKVIDINDEAPQFEKTLYLATVVENTQRLPSDVVRVRAIDRDEGPLNNQVTYSIGQESEEYFYIENRTGVIKVWRAIDRETHASFVILVTATDPAGLRDTARGERLRAGCQRQCADCDGRQLEVSENCSVGTLVGRIEAADPDSGEFGRIRFTLLPDPQSSAWSDFRVDSQSGSIRTNQLLDRERQQDYQLRIRVVDNPNGGSLQQNSVTATVTVRVLDINDNTPEIRFPRPGNRTFRVSWREAASQPVLQVLAVDLDEADNGKLRFQLVGDSNKELFDIDPDNGKI